MIRFIKWLFFTILGLIGGFIHAVAEVLVFGARWIFIAAVFGLAALVVVLALY